jgi:type VI protein secretion system component VasA
LTFSERYHKDGEEFLHHIVRVTGDETWVSFVNVETKEQSKQWMHTMLKQTVSSRKLMETLRQERKADGGIHGKHDHNSVRRVLRNTKKTA